MYQISAGTVKYFTPVKKPHHIQNNTVCCYLLYKTALLQQHCTPVQCEPLLKLIEVVSEDAEYPVVERLTMCGECPSPPGSPERCDNGEGAMGRYVTGSISSSSGTQLSSDSFHSAA